MVCHRTAVSQVRGCQPARPMPPVSPPSHGARERCGGRVVGVGAGPSCGRPGPRSARRYCCAPDRESPVLVLAWTFKKTDARREEREKKKRGEKSEGGSVPGGRRRAARTQGNPRRKGADKGRRGPKPGPRCAAPLQRGGLRRPGGD